jgi:NAD(P)H-quinone oxidoreductase subunit 5
LENAIGARLTHGPSWWDRIVPEQTRAWLYRFSMERGFLDAIIDEYIVRPFMVLFRWCDSLERRWTDFLSRGDSRESDKLPTHMDSVEDLV